MKAHPLDRVMLEIRNSLDRIAEKNGGDYLDKEGGIPASLFLLQIVKLAEDGSRFLNKVEFSLKNGKFTDLRIKDEKISARFAQGEIYLEMLNSIKGGGK